jgi:hypothetical protein
MIDEHSVFEYLYRDAGNNKIYGAILLSGLITAEEIEQIKSCLDEGLYFIPSKIGIPDLQSQMLKEYKYDDSLDHEFCEFRDLRPATIDDLSLPLWGKTTTLVERFKKNPCIV